MLKGLLGFLLFIFFVIVFIVLVAWGYIIRTINNFRKAVTDAAEMKEKRYREDIGRKRQQYSQREQPTQSGQQDKDYRRTADEDTQQEEVHRYETATGETIIDRHQKERESKKIFDDDDGEYVEFIEEKS